MANSSVLVGLTWGQICEVSWFSSVEAMKARALFADDADWGPIEVSELPADLWPMTPLEYGAMPRGSVGTGPRTLRGPNGGEIDRAQYYWHRDLGNGSEFRVEFWTDYGAKPATSDVPSMVEFSLPVDMSLWPLLKLDELQVSPVRPDWSEFVAHDERVFGFGARQEPVCEEPVCEEPESLVGATPVAGFVLVLVCGGEVVGSRGSDVVPLGWQALFAGVSDGARGVWAWADGSVVVERAGRVLLWWGEKFGVVEEAEDLRRWLLGYVFDRVELRCRVAGRLEAGDVAGVLGDLSGALSALGAMSIDEDTVTGFLSACEFSGITFDDDDNVELPPSSALIGFPL